MAHMMIPGIRIGCFTFLAGLLLATPLCAQDVLSPQPGLGGTSLPEMDNPPPSVSPPGDPNTAAASAHDPDWSPGPVTKYVKPTWSHLLQSMIHFNAYDIDDDDLLNEYLEVSDCDIFARFYQNDFAWHKIKSDEREYLRKSQDTLPAFFHYDTTLQFGHYDFDKNIYFFTDKTKISNVNSFLLMTSAQNPCPSVNVPIKLSPLTFHAVIPDPVGFYGIPMKPDVASALFDLMKLEKNNDRLVYTRFNLRITYIAPMEKRHQYAISGRMMYFQMGRPATSVRFDALLDSIDFYEDPNMTRLLYQYVPNMVDPIPSKPPATAAPDTPAK